MMTDRSFLILMLLAFTTVNHLKAQNSHRYTQPAHTFPQTMAWWDSIYLYPDFRSGFITYFTGFAPQHDLRLNYNLYYAQMDMIDAQGDTVQISPSKTFKSVSIGSDEFLYDSKEGYMRVLIRGDVALAERTFFLLSDLKYVSGSNGNNTMRDFDVRGRPSNYERYFVKTSIFFFVSSKGAIYPASRSILKKLFPEYKSAIQDFTRSHASNFSKEADLRKITQYCNGLRRIQGTGGMIVRAGERISQTLRDSMYRFVGFQASVVAYQDGRQRKYGSLNYNLMTKEMEAIENGDTVGINANRFVTMVNFDGTTYLRRSEGYVEVLLSGKVTVGVVRTLSMSHSQAVAASSKYGPYEVYDPDIAHLDRVNFDRMFNRKDEYYLIDEDGVVFTPSVASLHRLFPSAKLQLDEYMRTHQPDLQSEEGLKEVVSYVSGVLDR